MSKVILSTAYFPPVFFFSIIETYEKFRLEKFENYTKQTYRNRCCIYSANGKLTLSIPVKKGQNHKSCITDIEIDNTTKWQKVHWKAIESAYRSSPFYEFYIDDFIPFFQNTYRFLFDFNLLIINTLLKTLEIDKSKVEFTREFRKTYSESVDFRYSLHPKNKEPEILFHPRLNQYTQVFGEKYGFISNLSILDMLFNTGPDCKSFLEKQE